MRATPHKLYVQFSSLVKVDAVTGKVFNENLLNPKGPNESIVVQIFPFSNFGYTMYLFEYSCSSLASFVSVGYDKVIDAPAILVHTFAHSPIASI